MKRLTFCLPSLNTFVGLVNSTGIDSPSIRSNISIRLKFSISNNSYIGALRNTTSAWLFTYVLTVYPLTVFDLVFQFNDSIIALISSYSATLLPLYTNFRPLSVSLILRTPFITKPRIPISCNFCMSDLSFSTPIEVYSTSDINAYLVNSSRGILKNSSAVNTTSLSSLRSRTNTRCPLDIFMSIPLSSLYMRYNFSGT